MNFEEDVGEIDVTVHDLKSLVHFDLAQAEPLLNLAQMGMYGACVNPREKISASVRALLAAYSHLKRAGYEVFPKGDAVLDYVSRRRGG